MQGDPLAIWRCMPLGLCPSCGNCKMTPILTIRFGLQMMPLPMALFNTVRSWWDKIIALVPSYGYHANPSETVLVVKEEKLQEAELLFGACGVEGTTNASKYLGSTLGSEYS